MSPANICVREMQTTAKPCMLFLSYPPLPGNQDSPVTKFTYFSTLKAEIGITML